MKKNEWLRLILILVLTFAVFTGAMFALNLHTAPLIEANQKGAQFAPLLAVMPEGADFGADALLYDAADAAASELVGVPASVVAIYREANGMGYAVRCATESKYSKAPMELSIGVTADGTICGLQIDSYNDSLDFREKDAGYIDSYLGKDSALADVGIVAGTTFSSTAFKGAVSDSLSALIGNGLIAEGVKSDAQLLAEMIPTLHTGMAMDGMLKAEAVEPAGNIQSGFAALNGSGYAYIMGEGEAAYLVLVNANGNARVYDVAGNDVTADHAALAGEAAQAAGMANPYIDAAMAKFAKMVPDAENMESVAVGYNSVVAAARFTSGDTTCYGFYARPYGFDIMDVYIVIDETGAIVAVDAKTFVFEEEYFAAFGGMDNAVYRDGFTGLTADTFDGSQAVIATATMTSNAMKQAVNDAFAEFDQWEFAIDVEEVQENVVPEETNPTEEA